VLTARTAGGLEEVEEAIYASGGSATIAPMDLTENESVSRLAGACPSAGRRSTCSCSTRRRWAA
jgi:short-subunit dehydrogenase